MEQPKINPFVEVFNLGVEVGKGILRLEARIQQLEAELKKYKPEG